MIDSINTVVQALVWTTLAGLLYAVWLKSQTASSRFQFNLSVYQQQVVEMLHWMWLLLAVGLIISLLIFAWPRASQVEARPAINCAAWVARAGSDVSTVALDQCRSQNPSFH